MKKLLYIPVIILLISLDQLIKYYFNSNPEKLIHFWFLELNLLKNYGGLFGLPLFGGIFGQIIILTIITLLWFWVMTTKSSYFLTCGTSLILSGGFSNLIDRIYQGYVIDYINPGFWPVFNLGDAYISIGVVVIIWVVLFGKFHN